MSRKFFSNLFCLALTLVVAVSLACSASASVVVTYGSASESSASAGVLPVDGSSLFTTYGSSTLVVPNASALDYADASQGHGVTITATGTLAPSSGAASLLTNGAWQDSADSGSTSCWFTDNTSGSFLVDLGTNVAIGAVNTYSRQFYTNRAQQVYTLYGSTDNASWTLITDVKSALNFRVGTVSTGGLQGVSVTDDTGTVGTYRYLRFDVSPSDTGNKLTGASTFYGEIDVVAVPEPSTLALLAGGVLGLIAYAWRKRK
jgi:hypothetical protein